MTQKLFAVYLGGSAPKGNTELHDVVFAVGAGIEDTYEQLMDKWFGTPEGLHLDSWMELDIVDGHKVTLIEQKSEQKEKLYFVNLGAYSDGQFTEIHASKFLVAENAREAKARAKAELLKNWPGPVHKDDLYEVDDCLELGTVGRYFISLEKTTLPENLKPTNGYHIVPKDHVQAYMRHHLKAV